MTDQQRFQVITALISAGAALLGAVIGSLSTLANGFWQRKRDVGRQRLEDFYGPMLAIRSRIKAKSELRLKLATLAGEEWPKLVSTNDPEKSKKVDAQRWPEYERLIREANEDLGNEIIPAYKQMVDLFVRKMYLADECTRSFFPKLLEHVEILDMHYKKPLPREVAKRLDHSEQKLSGFYEQLEKQFVALKTKR